MASNTVPTYACHFPATCRQGGQAKRPLSVRVDLQNQDALQQLLESGDGGESFSAIIKAAWSLCLRCYTGLDDVCFGFADVGGPGEASRPDSLVGGIAADQVFACRIDSEVTLEELVRIAREHTPSMDSEAMKYQYNTAMLLRFGATPANTKQQLPTKGNSMSDKVWASLCLTHVVANECRSVSFGSLSKYSSRDSVSSSSTGTLLCLLNRPRTSPVLSTRSSRIYSSHPRSIYRRATFLATEISRNWRNGIRNL